MIRLWAGPALLLLALAAPASSVVAQDAVQGAIIGGSTGAIIGGLATGRPYGVIDGAITGGTAGAIMGSETERRHGYVWAKDRCLRRVPNGYVPVSRRYCY